MIKTTMSSLETTLSRASNKGDSLRTTVPSFIRKQFDLSEGDRFSWKLVVDDGKIIILITPVAKVLD